MPAHGNGETTVKSLVRAVLLTGLLFMAAELSAQTPVQRTAVELWRLGGPDASGPEAFSQEPGLVVDRSGQVFVRSRNPPHVSVFNGDGEYVRSMGRGGEGPGEFSFAFAHGLLGDTVWVVNWPAPRVSRFLADGTHLSTTRLEPIDFGVPLSAPQTVSAFMREGRAVAVPSGTPVGETGRVRLPVLFGDPGRPGHGVAEVSVPQGMMIPGVGSFAFEPVRVAPLFVASSTGEGFLTVDWNDDGSGDLRLSRYGYDGAHRWSRTIALPTGRIPDATRAAWIARGTDMARPHVEPAMRDGRIRGGSVSSVVQGALDLPTYFPPVDAVVLGLDGSIWLGRPAMGDEREWWVLDDGGVPRFSVRLPSAVNVRAAHGMSAWGTHLGEFDVPLVSRFQVR